MDRKRAVDAVTAIAVFKGRQVRRILHEGGMVVLRRGRGWGPDRQPRSRGILAKAEATSD